jgi:hypothetical protein
MSEPRQAASLLLEQRASWERGEEVRVEDYLRRHPALRDDPEGLLDLIYHEIFLREQQGAAPQLDEYLRRFPQFAEQLRMQLEVHEAFPKAPRAGPADAGGGWTPSAGRPPGQPPEAAEPVPGYEILGELGRGGMGVVYKARQVRLKRLVALKMILGGAHAGPRERARFHTEAEVVARLQHPNIVQVYEVGEHQGQPYMALELVEGGNLARLLRGGPQPPRAAAGLVEVLARAVQEAHQQGVLHRDLKPSNVLLTAQGVPKITDFGLAKLVNHEANQTPTEALIGTPSYMAPEQAAGHGKGSGTLADVYSLGAILYELLTGRPPFKGATVLETLLQVRTQEPVSPGRLRPRVPRDLETICLRCLHKDPPRRYAGGGELADDLARFREGKPVLARPTGAWQRGLKWAKRHPTLVGVSGGAALALVSLVSWHYGELRARLEEARAEVRAQEGARRREVEGQLEARASYRRFLDSRDEALFHGIAATMVTGLEPAAAAEASRRATRAALAEVAGAAGPLTLNPHWSAEERAEVTRGCYESLVVLAEVEVQAALRRRPAGPVPEAAEALRHLERAAALGLRTRAYHLRRARYLGLQGDRAGAAAEQRRAAAAAPEGALDLFLAGDERYREGKLAEAVADFNRALQRDPGHYWSLYYLGACSLRLGRPAEARAQLTAFLAGGPILSGSTCCAAWPPAS